MTGTGQAIEGMTNSAAVKLMTILIQMIGMPIGLYLLFGFIEAQNRLEERVAALQVDLAVISVSTADRYSGADATRDQRLSEIRYEALTSRVDEIAAKVNRHQGDTHARRRDQ